MSCRRDRFCGQMINREAPMCLQFLQADKRIFKGVVERTIWIEPGDMLAFDAIDNGERPANDNSPVFLNRDVPRPPPSPQALDLTMKPVVNLPVLIQANQTGKIFSVHFSKTTSHQKLPVV